MTSLSESIWKVNDNHEQVIIGAAYSLLALTVFPLYAPIFYTIRTRNEFKENISYKLISLLNVCDLLQSFNHVLSGIFIFFPTLALKIDPFVRIMGYTANTLWTASYVIIAVLAITRLAVTFFNLKPNKWTLWMKIILFLGGTYILVIWLIGCVTLNFQLVGVSWSYDMNAPFVDILSPIELYFCFPIMALSFGSYILILGNIYKKKRQAKNSSSLRTEIAILIQATVLTTYMATIMTLWHHAESWFEMSDKTLGLLNGSWILFAHLNAFLLIATNRTVRRQFISSLFGHTKPVTSVVGASSVKLPMSTSNHTIFETNSNKEQFIIGCIYSCVALAVFPIYVPIIYIIRVTKELNENISYKLINAMNIFDLLQSFGHFLTGIFIVFPIFTHEIYSFVIIVGYTANCLWNSSFVIIAVLAMTRLGVNFFHLRANKWKLWMKMILFIGGSYMFTVWLMGCIVSCFQLDSVNWSYNMNVPLSTFLSQQELYFCFSILIFSFGTYILIIGNIYRQKRQTQSLTSMRTEIGILTQATVLTTYMGAIMTLWHNAELWFEMTNITLALLNGSWLMFSHLNSFVLLATNRSIRNQFVKYLGPTTKPSKSIRSSAANSVFVTKQVTTVVLV